MDAFAAMAIGGICAYLGMALYIAIDTWRSRHGR